MSEPYRTIHSNPALAADDYRAECDRLRHELSEDGVTARRRMRDDIEILHAENERLTNDKKQLRKVLGLVRETAYRTGKIPKGLFEMIDAALADQGKG